MTTNGTAVLLDPLAELARQGSAYDWAGNDALHLDDRYIERQFPLLCDRTRADLGPDPGPGEFWPPVRSAVVPLDGHRLAGDAGVAAFLDELRCSTIGPSVWWPGLDRRVDRVHATLAAGLEGQPDLAAGGPPPVTVTVRGPWIGRFNTGRIYLPVQAADAVSAHALARVRDRVGAPHRPLLAGYLQLTADITGDDYRLLRDLVARYQRRVAVDLALTELWVMDTMDDLVLRSRTAARIPLSAARPVGDAAMLG
jgi:hypothetical protein